jgi:glycosyltransferase involved in cell wall biosynthesis
MNILQICNKSPYPPKEGGPIAMYNLAEGLIDAGHKVTVLAINTPKYFVDINGLPEDYRNCTSFSAVYIDTSLRFLGAFINLFSSGSYHVERFDSQAMHQRIAEILQEKKFDVIQLETIYIGPYIETIRRYSNARIVLRAHNIEHLIWQRIAKTTKNPLKRMYLSYLADKLRKYETSLFRRVDGIACISDIDAQFIKGVWSTVPVETIPFGMKVPEKMSAQEYFGDLTFFHLGSMDWMPNQEGIRWFLDCCMPLLAKEFPNNRIRLAGRNMPAWVYDYTYSNLEIVGEVDDALAFIGKQHVMFVPLFSGSGVRIKIIEGMAMGKAIISTIIGAEGIEYKDGENILIANTPEQFVEKFRFCINHLYQCKLIGANASKLIYERHNLVKTTLRLTDFYDTLS